MNQGFDVLLVSAFGRGNWLAMELCQKGYKVGLVDVSERLGRWTPEDWEGPFGYSEASHLIDSQKHRMSEDDYFEEVPEGWSLLLPDGPLDFRSILSPYLLEKYGITGGIKKVLQKGEEATTFHRDEKEFQKWWIVELAQSLAAPIMNYFSEPLSFFSPLYVRRPSRAGRRKSLEWLKDLGVSVFYDAQIKDISLRGKLCEGVEVQAGRDELLRAQQYVWMLTSLETEFLSSQVTQKLFKSVANPLFSWVRYRFTLKGYESFMSYMPLHFILIEDIYLPWFHSNLLILQQTAQNESVDVWVRLPSQYRFEKDYLENMAEEIKQLLEERMPYSQPHLVDYPQEYHYSSKDLGPSRFYVYEKPGRILRLSNLLEDHPEQWPQQDWSGMFSYQNETFEKLLQNLEKEK
ncbi:MAG: hypothetical protein D6797_05695, partial [Bdellovibrio sp.]